VKAQILEPPKNELVLIDWLKLLVDDIKMKILDGPYVKYLDVEGNRGITGIVVIETSHCSVHIWDEPNPAIMQMDVYSCADFNTSDVIKRVKDFSIVDYQKLRVDRNGDKFKIVERRNLKRA
jgi:S-adenosylmethionine/arginine decarboxylase-like enzyme